MAEEAHVLLPRLPEGEHWSFDERLYINTSINRCILFPVPYSLIYSNFLIIDFKQEGRNTMTLRHNPAGQFFFSPAENPPDEVSVKSNLSIGNK